MWRLHGPCGRRVGELLVWLERVFPQMPVKGGCFSGGLVSRRMGAIKPVVKRHRQRCGADGAGQHIESGFKIVCNAANRCSQHRPPGSFGRE